ncbi:MAG TPA: tetratricopeptide repeat protein [Blastocatellia bacterium]|nr:tetratricopeptide repeat protein [Blastocatellia bacterium]
MNGLGNVLRKQGELARARGCYERALVIDEMTYGRDHFTVGMRHDNLGYVLEAMGDFKGAREHFEIALPYFQKRWGRNHQYTKNIRSKLELLPK